MERLREEGKALLQEFQRNASATKIQSSFRGKLVRAEMERLREEGKALLQEFQRNASATKIQSSFRGKLVRSEIERLREQGKALLQACQASSFVEETEITCAASSDAPNDNPLLEQRALTSLGKIQIVIAAFDSNDDGHLDFHDSNELQK